MRRLASRARPRPGDAGQGYQHWPRVRQADNPDAYVRRILVNEVRGRWRHRQKDLPAASLPAEPYTPDAADDIARRDRLRTALFALPLQQRATVVLRYFEGMTQRETAEALGCSEGTVKSQSSRALIALRTFLDRTESVL